MRKALAYILTTPACLLFLLAEAIRGEKVVWRGQEFTEHWLSGQPDNRCTKCGHIGKLHLDPLTDRPINRERD